MELEGLGREVWQRVDVEEYLRQDAIQVATAIQAEASHFPTNDAALARVPGISVLVAGYLPED
jgi:hypothetical protein